MAVNEEKGTELVGRDTRSGAGGTDGRAERGTGDVARLEEGRKEVFGVGKGFKVRVGVLGRSGSGCRL